MKKLMAILLAAVLVLTLSISAFAYVIEEGVKPVLPSNLIDNEERLIPRPDQISRYDDNWPPYFHFDRDFETETREEVKRSSVVIEIGPKEEPEEDNPTTGAPVISFIPAAAVICGAALLLRKKNP